MVAAAPAPEKLSLQKKKGKDKYILMEIKTEIISEKTEIISEKTEIIFSRPDL